MSDWRPFVYGGVSSVLAETGTFPIDTTKTRLQIQGQVIDSAHTKIKYRGMLHAFTRICSEEGVAALYAGLAPALLRQATYGTIKIGIYHSLKRTFFTEFREERLLPNICCGCVAGMVASTIANPTDVLKVRLQAHNADFENMGMARAFSEIYYNEGVRGLWRGVGPTATRAAVVAGVELPVYDWCKKLLIYTANFSDGVHTHFMSSFIAGFAGAVASNPIDVVRTRLMNQRKLVNISVPNQHIYSGSIDCFLQTYRTEGFWALYRGFIPNWLRLGPWNIIFFISFEQLKKTY